ncbi:MAG: RNA polymerase sigma factor [Candidatus Dojkabacteria bacterium]|jgi:RNA polymerase sigma-70 factor (ECF subfamily)|nr:RNA polymerase sigma factor [Candidatus Dojkabacteria bacterium]
MSINKLNSRQDLENLFKWLNEPLYKYVYIRCGYNRELAEDITQDIFVKAWEKRTTFNPSKSTLKNWIYVIARNYLIDTYRKKKISVKSFDEDIYVKDLNISVEDESAVSDILRNLDRLKEKEKEVIVLRYVQDLEIEGIAKILGKSKNTTKVMIHRAIKKLKYIMNK